MRSCPSAQSPVLSSKSLHLSDPGSTQGKKSTGETDSGVEIKELVTTQSVKKYRIAKSHSFDSGKEKQIKNAANK